MQGIFTGYVFGVIDIFSGSGKKKKQEDSEMTRRRNICYDNHGHITSRLGNIVASLENVCALKYLAVHGIRERTCGGGEQSNNSTCRC